MGIWIDDEVRGLMRAEAARERAASLFAGIIVTVICVAVVGAVIAMCWFANHESPSKASPATPQRVEQVIVTPA